MKTPCRTFLAVFSIWLGILAASVAAAPLNDTFASAAVLTGLPVATTGSNAHATLEPGEPLPDEGYPEASVWFDWTAPASGNIRIDTQGSAFDTVLAVWTGNSLNALTELASNDDTSLFGSAVFLTVQAGVHYRIAVYGYDISETGDFHLNIGADTSSHIRGKVTGLDGTSPLPGIEVIAFTWDEDDEEWIVRSWANSGADGTYDIAGLGAGNHRLQFRGDSRDHVTEFYNNAATLDSAQDILVQMSVTVTGIDAALAPSSRISGTVTGPDAVVPLQGINVIAYHWDSDYEDWDTVSETYTGADGTYIIRGLDPGSYRIRFVDEDFGYYLEEYYENVRTLEAATDVIVGVSSTTGGVNASLSEGSRIAGNVTGPTGSAPLAGITVTAYRSNYGDWDDIRSTRTLADGSYALRGLSGGIYRLGFSDDGGGYQAEYYNNVESIEDAANIIVPTETVVGGIDASLLLTSRIAGTVTGPDGLEPLEGIGVLAYRWNLFNSDWEYFNEVSTDEDGKYRIGDLLPGKYRLKFVDYASGIHASEYYDNAVSLESAANIIVAAQTHVDGIDASLTELPRISGVVTGPDGVTALEDIEVTVYEWDGEDGYWNDVAYAYTLEDGSYVVHVPKGGVYRVGFHDYDEIYQNEYYQDALTIVAAVDITVAALPETGGINASLALASRITGTVSGPEGALEGISVRVYRQNIHGDWDEVRGTSTREDGTYSIGNLLPGTYRVGFADEDRYVHIGEYFDNVGTLDEAADIVVGSSVVVTGIDAVLSLGSAISGTVTGADGITPLEYIRIIVYRAESGGAFWNPMNQAYSDEDGFYRVGSLEPGTYRLGFSDYNEEIYSPEFYENAATVETAGDIVVGTETEMTGINASLSDGSKISGMVTGGNEAGSLEGTQVTAYRWFPGFGYWESIQQATSQADGSYRIRGLDAGTYRVGFSDPSGTYKNQYHAGSTDLANATDISVAADAEVFGIDAILSPTSRISGVVTMLDGVTPLEYVGVSAYRWNSDEEYWDWFGYSYSDENGVYRIGNLEAGTYRIQFTDDDEGIYLTECYDNVADLNAATDIVVGDGVEVTGIDASLSTGNRISGNVTGPDGLIPLRGILVSAYVWSSDYEDWREVQSGYTNMDGDYSLNGFGPGSYRVAFFDRSGKYMTGYFDQGADLESATDIVVSADIDVSGIDAALIPASRILGTVTAIDGLTPLENIEVELNRWNPDLSRWEVSDSVQTDEDGKYVIGRLKSGSYRIGFRTDGQYGFGDEWYDNSGTLAGAADVVVPTATDVMGIDASLSEGGRISGVITARDGITRLEYIRVTAYVWDGEDEVWTPARTTWTSENGVYSFRGLSENSYRLGFSDEYGLLRNEFFNDVLDIEGAADISLAAHQEVSGINASISDGAAIAGMVTGPDGVTPVEGIRVDLYVWYQEDGYADRYASSYTGADGRYEFRELAPGTYRIGFVDDGAGIYLDEFHSGSVTVEDATDIVLVGDSEVNGIDASLMKEVVSPPAVVGFRTIGAGSFELDFAGPVGEWFQLQQSSDLGTWTDVGEAFECEPGTNTLPASSMEPKMFWRVRSEP